MPRYSQRRVYRSDTRLFNVQVGSVLSLWQHKGFERLMCDFAGTYCETDCVFEDAGYKHPVTIIEIHGKGEQVSHPMLFVTFISMTTHPKESFKTLPVVWYANAETKIEKESFWVLPHTYTLPLYRFKPFIGEAGSASILPTNNPPLKRIWLHCDTGSSSWLELATVNDLVRKGKNISIAANYPPDLDGSDMVRKLGRKTLQYFSSNRQANSHNQENSESSKPQKTLNSRARSSPTSEIAGRKHSIKSFGQSIAPAVPARHKRRGMADVKLEKAPLPISPVSPTQEAIKLPLESKNTFIDPQNPYSALGQDGDSEWSSEDDTLMAGSPEESSHEDLYNE